MPPYQSEMSVLTADAGTEMKQRSKGKSDKSVFRSGDSSSSSTPKRRRQRKETTVRIQESFNVVHEIPLYSSLLSCEELGQVFYTKTELQSLKTKANRTVRINEGDNIVHEVDTATSTGLFYSSQEITLMMAEALKDVKGLKNKNDMRGLESLTKSGKSRQEMNRKLAKFAVLKAQRRNDNIACAYGDSTNSARSQAMERGRLYATQVYDAFDYEEVKMIQRQQQRQEQERREQEREQEEQGAAIVDFVPSDLELGEKKKKKKKKKKNSSKKDRADEPSTPTTEETAAASDDDQSVVSSASSIFSFFSASSRRSTSSTRSGKKKKKKSSSSSSSSSVSSGRSVTNTRRTRKSNLKRR